jgi:pentatricopeptide repeat protein
MSEVGAELLMCSLFCLGFVLARVATRKQIIGTKGYVAKAANMARRKSLPTTDPDSCAKQLEANWAAGRADLVLVQWPKVQCFTVGALRAVIEAFVSVGQGAQIYVALGKILAKHGDLRTQEALAAACDAAGNEHLAADVRQAFAGFSIPAAKAPQVSCTVAAKAPQDRSRGGPAVYVQRLRNALQSKRPEHAVHTLADAAEAGVAVPPGCVAAVLRLLCEVAQEGQLDCASSVAATVALIPTAMLLCSETLVACLEYGVRAGDFQLLLALRTRAVQCGTTWTPGPCEALLRGLASAGDGQAVQIFDEIVGPGKVELPEASIIAVIVACVEPRQVQLAERCIEHARHTQGQLTVSQCTALMRVYGHARMFQKTCELYDRMQQDRVVPDKVAYGCLIRAAVESGRSDLARQLFSESGNPDLLNCMSLIRAAGRERNLPKALALLGQLESSPCGADVAAYNCALEACANCGDLAAGDQLLRRMEANTCIDVVSYNTYLKLISNQGDSAKAESILSSMKNCGVEPNVVTYNSLIKFSVSRHDRSSAWRLVGDMEQYGLRPDAFTCSILMGSPKQATSVYDVDQILSLVRRAKINPDEVLITGLIESCVRLRDVDRLTQIIDDFKPTGGMLTPHATAMLIRGLGHSKQLDRVWVVWRDVVGNGSRIEALHEEVFGTMVEVCLANGDIEGAVSVWHHALPVVEKFTRAAAIFASTVKACVQNKRAHVALELYESMKEVVTCTIVTYNTLIDALVRRDDLTRATALFRQMALQGASPDLITYSTLIKGHCSRGELEEALRLLGLMQRRGIMPDAVLFNSMLDGCAHKQMRCLTEMVLKDMGEANVVPSNVTISILVKLYGRCGDLPAAFQVVEEYPKKYGFKANQQVYTCLMSACISNNAQCKAMVVYKNMIRDGCVADARTYRTLLSGCTRSADVSAARQLVEDMLQGGVARAVDRDVLESMLLMASRQGGQHQDDLLLMLKRLTDAGVHVSERVRDAAMLVGR